MPKTLGPLMSMEASGTIGGLINYRQTKRGNIARVNSRPTGEASIDQLSRRALMRFLTKTWTMLPVEAKNSYGTVALGGMKKAFENFIAINHKRFNIGLAPIMMYNSAPINPEGLTGGYSCELVNNKLIYRFEAYFPSLIWCGGLHLSNPWIDGSEINRVFSWAFCWQEFDDTIMVTIPAAKLPPGTWYASVSPVYTDGTWDFEESPYGPFTIE